MKDEWAHEKSLEVFRKQAQGTFTIKDPIAPIEEALLEVERETEKRVREEIAIQCGLEYSDLGLSDFILAIKLSPSERNEKVKGK